MRLRSLLASVTLIVAACGGTGPSGDDDDGQAGADSDGDTIADDDEGAPGIDTDADGTADYLDDDSDGDGLPDYREAGDGDTETAPVDSDGDGAPDFRDTDSDGNGRRDGDDGLGDLDDDGHADFADLDDDGDGMNDVLEIGGDPAAPVDSDADGTADFQDIDSDADGVRDSYEGASDYDDDGIRNYLDLDADGDCVLDAMEGGNPPRDADQDHRWDFLDRDSDNDGIADTAEDANCNGEVDAGETDAADGDSDDDGVTDLVEVSAGTDPNDAADNPQANGDFVFVEPYQAPQTPTDDDLDFATDLQKVDVYVIVDRSGSMSTEITAVRDNLAQAIDGAQCPPLGNGSTDTCVPDLWAGGGTLGYAGGSSFANYRDIQPNPTFTTLPVTEPSGCCQEAETFALWSAITGNGSATSGCSVSSLAARTSCAGSPAANAGYQTFGYPCFRVGALPVVILATDEAPRWDGADTYECPAWANTVRNQFAGRSAKLMGVLGSEPASHTLSDLQLMATETGAVDAANGNAPLVFDGAGSNADNAIAQGIRTLANGLPLDLSAIGRDDTSDAVDAVASFVDHLETLQSGTAQCAAGLTDQDSNADGFDDSYVDVRTGTPVCWKVFSKQNTTVPATAEPQLFRATVEVYGDGVTVLDTRDVFFLVPPAPFDPPIT